jgi:alkylhydroperoxidase family enzyme
VRCLLVSVLALSWQAAFAAPRLAPVPAEDWSAAQRALAAQFATGPAAMPNAVATYLHHPSLAEHTLPFERYISSESRLEPRQRELLALRTAWLARSEYVWAHRAAVARTAGFTVADLERVAAGPAAPSWSPLEAALLQAADELHTDSFVAAATWRTLAFESAFDFAQLMDIVFTVGEFTMIAGVVNSLGVEIEEGFDDRLPRSGVRSVAARTGIRLAAPRIATIEPEHWTPEIRALLDPTGSGRRVANVYRTYAHNVPLDRLRRGVSEHIRDATTLTDRQREILLLRIGVLCLSEYEWSAHERIGRQVGLTDADLERIVAGPEGAPASLETALLRATDELHRDDIVTQATWDALAAEFDSRQLLDVLIAIGGYRMLSMAMNSFGVQLDPNAVRFPPSLRSAAE